MNIVGSCLFYLVHLDTKKLQEVTFYVAKYDGSVLLSCTTTLVLGLIQPHTNLDYLPPRASLITSSLDHPKKIKRVSVHISRKEVSTESNSQAVTVPDAKQLIPKLVARKELTLQSYPDVFEGIACFPGPPCHVQLFQSIIPK